ncbi:MAG: hypothetical protein ACRDLL_11075, partial [Solirubrobacterales bacterium]
MALVRALYLGWRRPGRGVGELLLDSAQLRLGRLDLFRQATRLALGALRRCAGPAAFAPTPGFALGGGRGRSGGFGPLVAPP